MRPEIAKLPGTKHHHVAIDLVRQQPDAMVHAIRAEGSRGKQERPSNEHEVRTRRGTVTSGRMVMVFGAALGEAIAVEAPPPCAAGMGQSLP